MWHNHSPGFEVLPNGDVLAVWFSSSTSGVGGEPVRTNARGLAGECRLLLAVWNLPVQQAELCWELQADLTVYQTVGAGWGGEHQHTDGTGAAPARR